MKNKAFNIILIILLVAVIALCVYLLVWDIILQVEYANSDSEYVMSFGTYLEIWSHPGRTDEPLPESPRNSYLFYSSILLFLQNSVWIRLTISVICVILSIFAIGRSMDKLVGGRFSEYVRTKFELRKSTRADAIKLKKQARIKTKKQKLIEKLKKLEEDS